MRYCRIYDPVALGRTTLREYAMMMESVRLRKEDELRLTHMLAWLTQQAKATKKAGKKIVPYFKSFDDFCPVGRPKPQVSQEEKRFAALIAQANGRSGKPPSAEAGSGEENVLE